MASSQLTAYTGVLNYPTYTRQPKRSLPALFNEGTPAIYPVPLDDLLDGPKKLVPYAAIFLENEHLKLTILPDQGGKIWSVFDKHANDEVIYVPDVIRPSLIAANGAWIPGGLEYNFPVGHHAATMASVPCAIVENTPERVAVLTEIRHPHSGLRLDALVSLRAGEARFDIKYVAWNPSATPHRWGFWCNVGTWAHDGWQFFSKAKLYHTGSTLHDYPVDEGVDSSWWKNRAISSDSFMMGNLDYYFGYYDHTRGLGLAHISPDKSMRGMKYHTWGRKLRNYWPEVCFTEDNRNYTEIQSGRHETQMDFGILQPGGADRFCETWVPYRQTGGIEWMNRDVVFQVRAGKPCVYCPAEADVSLSADGKRAEKRVRAGGVETFPQSVAHGAQVELCVNGVKVFASAYPYAGTQEPRARERIQDQHGIKPLSEPHTAAEHLAVARRKFELDQIETALRHYRAAVKLAPKDHAAAFELAGCLWRVGEFDEGAKLLTKLLKTPLKTQAETRLALRERGEDEFFGNAALLPRGVERAVALAERFAGYNNAVAALPLLTQALRAEPSHVRANFIMAALALKAQKNPKQAVRHLKIALKAQPDDRDLILELAHAQNAAGEFAETVKLLDHAAKAIRELSAARKLLSKALFETGADKRCHELMTTHRLFNWEAELWQLDVYLNTTLALSEAALARGAAKEALRYALAAQGLPPTLGMETKHMSHARRKFWLGLALRANGKEREALADFRAGFENMLAESATRRAGRHSERCAFWVTPEDAYMTLRCAQELDDAAALRSARDFAEGFFEARRLYGAGPGTDLLRAFLAEFDGNFRAAAKLLKTHISENAETRIARMHHAAVGKGKRRGDF